METPHVSNQDRELMGVVDCIQTLCNKLTAAGDEYLFLTASVTRPTTTIGSTQGKLFLDINSSLAKQFFSFCYGGAEVKIENTSFEELDYNLAPNDYHGASDMYQTESRYIHSEVIENDTHRLDKRRDRHMMDCFVDIPMLDINQTNIADSTGKTNSSKRKRGRPKSSCRGDQHDDQIEQTKSKKVKVSLDQKGSAKKVTPTKKSLPNSESDSLRKRGRPRKESPKNINNSTILDTLPNIESNSQSKRSRGRPKKESLDNNNSSTMFNVSLGDLYSDSQQGQSKGQGQSKDSPGTTVKRGRGRPRKEIKTPVNSTKRKVKVNDASKGDSTGSKVKSKELVPSSQKALSKTSKEQVMKAEQASVSSVTGRVLKPSRKLLEVLQLEAVRVESPAPLSSVKGEPYYEEDAEAEQDNADDWDDDFEGEEEEEKHTVSRSGRKIKSVRRYRGDEPLPGNTSNVESDEEDESYEEEEESDEEDLSVYKAPAKIEKGKSKPRRNPSKKTKFRCEICSYYYPSFKCLRRHKLYKHNTTCLRCNKKHSTCAQLREHKKTCTETNAMTCDLCGKVCHNEGSYTVHLATHSLKCRYCRTEFDNKDDLKKHRIICMNARFLQRYEESRKNADTSHDNDAGIDLDDSDEEYKAILKFRLKSNKKKKDKVTATPPVGDSKYQCGTCGKCFSSQKYLRRHEYRHETKLTCPNCKVAFLDRIDLLVHKRKCKKPLEKPAENTKFTCEICGKICNNRGAFQLHQKSHSTKCRYCNEELESEQQLKYHKRRCEMKSSFLTRYTDGKPKISCKLCGRLALNMGSLRRHELAHLDNDYKFVSEMCGISVSDVEKMAAIKPRSKAEKMQKADDDTLEPKSDLNDSLFDFDSIIEENRSNIDLDNDIENVVVHDAIIAINSMEMNGSSTSSNTKDKDNIQDPNLNESAVQDSIVTGARNDVGVVIGDGTNATVAIGDGTNATVAIGDGTNATVAIGDGSDAGVVTSQHPDHSYIELTSGNDPSGNLATDLTCKICDHDFTSIVDLFTHAQLHKRYACHLCNSIVKGPKTLVTHLRVVHSEERNHVCTSCGKSFKTGTTLRKHISVMHDPYRAAKQVPRKAQGPFICEICNKECDTKKKLTKHSYSHTGEASKCPMCDKVLKNKIILRNHLKLVHVEGQPHGCDKCGKTYKTVTNLKEHIHNVHTDHGRGGKQPKFRCEVCLKYFHKKYFKNLHMKTHTKEKPLSCQHCGKRFLQRGNLNKHIAVTHLKTQLFDCSLCKKSFTLKEMYQLHMRNHVVENDEVSNYDNTYGRIYKCEICAFKYFARRSSYLLHMKSHGGDKPYGCPLCKKFFLTASKVLRHLHIHFRKGQFTTEQLRDMFKPQIIHNDCTKTIQETIPEQLGIINVNADSDDGESPNIQTPNSDKSQVNTIPVKAKTVVIPPKKGHVTSTQQEAAVKSILPKFSPVKIKTPSKSTNSDQKVQQGKVSTAASKIDVLDSGSAMAEVLSDSNPIVIQSSVVFPGSDGTNLCLVQMNDQYLLMDETGKVNHDYVIEVNQEGISNSLQQVDDDEVEASEPTGAASGSEYVVFQEEIVPFNTMNAL